MSRNGILGSSAFERLKQPMSESHLLWNERQLPSRDPKEWRLDAESFAHLDSLYLSCTQTSLPAAAQRKLVDRWCEIIPALNVTSLVLGTKTNQKLVDAAFRLSKLRHLEIGWGAEKSLLGIANCRELTSLKIRSTPALTGLAAITVLDKLEVLAIENVKEARTLNSSRTCSRCGNSGSAARCGRTRRLTVSGQWPGSGSSSRSS